MHCDECGARAAIYIFTDATRCFKRQYTPLNLHQALDVHLILRPIEGMRLDTSMLNTSILTCCSLASRTGTCRAPWVCATWPPPSLSDYVDATALVLLHKLPHLLQIVHVVVAIPTRCFSRWF